MNNIAPDPLWNLLNRRLRLGTRSRSLALALGVGMAEFLLLPSITGFLMPRQDAMSSSEDLQGLVITFLTHPVIYLYYLTEQPRIIEALFDGLKRWALQQELLPQLQALNDQAGRWLMWPGWQRSCLLMTVAGYLLHVRAVLMHNELSYYNPGGMLLYIFYAPVSALAGYMLGMIVVRHSLIVTALFRFFPQTKATSPSVQSKTPNTLGFIGHYVTQMVYLAIILVIDFSMLIVINLQFGANPFADAIVTAFLIGLTVLAPVGLLIPLVAPGRGQYAYLERSDLNGVAVGIFAAGILIAGIIWIYLGRGVIR